MVKIRQLIWDNWNVRHIKRHKVNENEVEEACRSQLKSFKTYKERLIIFGKTKKGKLLTVILSPEGAKRYYVVTARNMSRKERSLLNDQD